MQNRRKEDQGYIISLILTFAARWVQLFFAFLGSMIPEQFQDLIPSALVMFFIWSVPICQAAACFVAIRYIQRSDLSGHCTDLFYSQQYFLDAVDRNGKLGYIAFWIIRSRKERMCHE